ncbi:MAG: carbohydrate kinase family protein [Promethearchaeota archaeon]
MVNEKILVLGSIAYDFIMSFSGNMNETISTDSEDKVFNLAVMPEDKIKSFGGTAGNIGYNLSKLGVNAGLITSVGQDFVELGYQSRIESFPNVSFEGKIHPDSHSASCYIVNDSSHNQLIIFHRGAMVRGEDISIKGVYSKENVKIASISPDYSPAMMKWGNEFKELDVPFLFDPGQVTPEFTPEMLLEIIPKSYITIGNEYEISMILKKLNYSLEQLLNLNPNIIITKGPKGSECHYQGKTYEIPICTPKAVEDPTGAGDGFRAGLLFGLAKGFPFEIACRIGSVVGSFVVESAGPQSQIYTRESIQARYKANFGESISL